MAYSETEINELVNTYYGFEAEAKLLSGYDEMNYLIKNKVGEQFILKVAGDAMDFDTLYAQLQMINHLSATSMRDKFQKVIRNKKNELMTILNKEGKNYCIRVLSFLDGSFWYEKTESSEERFENLGRFLGEMDKQLKGFSPAGLYRSHTWDLSRSADAEKKLKYIKDPAKRRIAGYFLLQFEMEVASKISILRHAAIHNDVNDYNILVNGSEITGLIDFGDAVYSALINNLAIACTYSLLHQDEPLQLATKIIKGYHEVYPLLPEESDILYYLIAARLCISVTQSAYNAAMGSNNEHHFLSEKPAWNLLEKWIRINPLKAADLFRKACGFERLIHPENHASLLKERKEFIGRNLSLSYKQPLKIIKGALQYLYDDKGNTFVDCVNNVSHVGHCHPVVVRTMQNQIATLNTNTRYLNDAIVDYAKKLTATLPAKLKVCYFVNSGSEANDLAIRMARHYTQRQDVIVLDHAYHGTSTLAIEMSPYKFDSKGGSGKKPYIHKALSPDLYRGPYQYNDSSAGEKYAISVLELLRKLEVHKTAAAAFICETILGVGGQIPLPDGYLQNVYQHVHKYGGVCIADEVQVGFGRVGEKFWGFELQGVEPDIVVMGKPMGNGHPLAAVVVTDEIANAFNNGLEYFNTYGGNPVSMISGLAVLKVIQEENLQENALQTGNFLLQLLKDLQKKHTVISDVRGHGLFIGAELVKDKITKDPAVPEIDSVIEQMKDRGFLLSTDGPLHNVIKIKPPIVFNSENAKALAENLDEVLSELNM